MRDRATALHYGAEAGDRLTVTLLPDAGADVNARDSRIAATPAGWAIEYVRRARGTPRDRDRGRALRHRDGQPPAAAT